MIFFDLDGTLIDHDYAVRKALTTMLSKQNIKTSMNEDEVYHLWNKTLENYYNLYLQGKLSHSEQRRERMKAFYNHFNVTLSDIEVEKVFYVYLSSYERNWLLYDDVLDILNSLNDRRLGIISNGALQQQANKLKKTELDDYFEILVTSQEIGIAKPNKDIFLHACTKAEVNIKDCIYIGDRWETDALGSREAGMKAIWLDRSGNYRKVRNSIDVITSLWELKGIL